jgi:rubrerythrin
VIAVGKSSFAAVPHSALAETTGPGPIRDLFKFLADEETQHKNELEKIYYEVVHSGGV